MNDHLKFEIETSVPFPAPARNVRKYPLSEMAIGDSFFASAPDSDRGGTQALISATVSAFARRSGKKFTVRQVDGGVRVWRLA